MSEVSLYNERIKLKFSPGNHCYYANGKICQGVTSALKTLYDQSDLLEWYSSMASNDIVMHIAGPDNEEWLKDAFLAIYSGSEPVIPADLSIDSSFDGTALIALYMKGKNAPLNRSQFGKDVGTQTHEAVDRYHKTGEAYIDNTGIEANDTAAQRSLDAYVKWFTQSGLEVVASEVMVYSIEHNYAGTLDRIYKKPNGDLIMGDFKTSNLSKKAPLGIRPSYWSQIGAYMKAYREEHGVEFADAVIVNSPKKGAIKIGYVSDMGVTPLELENIWLDDLKALRNHRDLEKKQYGLKSRV